MLTAALAVDLCKGGTTVRLANIQLFMDPFPPFSREGQGHTGVFDLMVRRVGIEPTTYCLKGSYSTS